jgi:hypothetical protein
LSLKAKGKIPCTPSAQQCSLSGQLVQDKTVTVMSIQPIMGKTPPPLPKKPGTRWLPLSIIGAFILAPILIFVIWRIHISGKVDRQLEEVAKRGYPTTMAELEQKYYAPIPSNQNLALYYQQLYQNSSFSNSLKGLDGLLSTNQAAGRAQLFSERFEKMRAEFLSKNRDLLDALHKVQPGTNGRYPLKFEMGYAVPLPHLRRLSESVQLLSLTAVSHAQTGGSTQTMEDLNAIFRICQSFADEPFLISHLVRIKFHRNLTWCLERVLSRQALSTDQLAELEEAFRKEENPQGMERAMVAERCTGAQLFQSSPSGFAEIAGNAEDQNADESDGAHKSKTALGWQLMKVSGFTGRDFSYYLNILEQEVAIARLPFPDRLAASEQLHKNIPTETRKHIYLFSGLLLPALDKAQSKAAIDSAHLNLALTALSIERFRLANGDKLPDQLTNLVPAYLNSVPKDPFDGSPLRYKKLERGYLIYSIGKDGKDDGGVEAPPKKPNAPADIPFRVER